jgi:hypothetical protein
LAALQTNHEEAAQVLLEARADPNIANHVGGEESNVRLIVKGRMLKTVAKVEGTPFFFTTHLPFFSIGRFF